MRHIGIDCRFASVPVGIGRYTRELVSALLRHEDPWKYVLFVRSADEQWLRSLSGNVRIVPFDARHYSLREQFVLPRLLQRAHVDMLFSPQFNVPYRCPVPYICTVHDLILHRFPNSAGLPTRTLYRVLFRRAIAQARHVVTVSNATRDDVLYTYGSRYAERVSAIYPGIDTALFHPPSADDVARVRMSYGLPKTFFLYVGNAKQHKNVPLLLDAFSSLPDDNGVGLVLVCSGPEADALVLPPRVLRLSHVADRDMPAIYGACAGYVSASLCEGFGFPLLEAMACGAPVVAVAGGSVPEVTAGHARLCDASAAALSEALMSLLRTPPSSAKRDACISHAASFEWTKTADAVASLFSTHLSALD